MPFFVRRLAPWLFVCLATACSGTQERSPSERVGDYRALSPDIYRLIPGDSVSISIYQEGDLSGKYRIEPDGTINFPLIGRVPAEGETIEQLERRLQRRLSEGYLVDPDIRVSIAKYKPIFVVGAVRSPGEYAFKPGLTAQQAIFRAGGPTKFASEKIYVQRNDQPPSQSYRISADTALYPGDLISVEERMF